MNTHSPTDHPRIFTRCPSCHNDTLTINKGHLLCTWHECKDPTLIDRIGDVGSKRTAIELDGMTVSFLEGCDTERVLFNKLLAFFREHETFSGESICQMDGPQIAAPQLLSEIADDILKFKLEYK